MAGGMHIHLIGIGGTGLSPIARILHARGYRVSGCDVHPGPATQALQALGIPVFSGHDPAHLEGVDLVVRTSALREHPEIAAAVGRGIPVLTRKEFLPQLTRGYRTLAVAGTHGKTTTTAMLAWALLDTGHDPTYIVGGVMENTGLNGYAGQGPFFVIEADEYDHMFLGLEPEAAILTYVDYDHPDFFPTPQTYLEAFRAFVERVRGPVVFWAEDVHARRAVAGHSRAFSFGLQPAADYRAQVLAITPAGTRFRLFLPQGAGPEVDLPMAGWHNVRNALAVLALSHLLGLNVDAVARSLARFRGVRRRFTVVAQHAGWILVSDYGHHPVEIRATLQAARQRYPEHALWAVWQPHTYSRTLRLLPEFAHALARADGIVVTDVYAAREVPPQGFHVGMLARAFAGLPAHFVPTPLDAVPVLLEQVRPPAVVLVFSAGDAPVLLDELVRHFKQSTISTA